MSGQYGMLFISSSLLNSDCLLNAVRVDFHFQRRFEKIWVVLGLEGADLEAGRVLLREAATRWRRHFREARHQIWDEFHRKWPLSDAWLQVRARLHYVTKSCDIGHMAVWSLLIMGLEHSRQNQKGGFQCGDRVGGCVDGGDFILRDPNPLLKSDQKLSRVRHLMVESRSLNGP